MMVNRQASSKGKGLIRSLNRKGAKSNKDVPANVKMGIPPEPSICERCGAVFSRRTWRRDRKLSDAVMDGAHWTVCPSCQQVRVGEYFGRVVLRGAFVAANEEAIRHRIQNVAARAEFTQPQRRVVSVEPDSSGLEVLTTSQKLAHRIVHELKKAFRGHASYSWSDRDGTLFAKWERDDVPAPKVTRGRR